MTVVGTWRSRKLSELGCALSVFGGASSLSGGGNACKKEHARDAPGFFPPEVRAAVTHLACQKPGTPIPLELIRASTESSSGKAATPAADQLTPHQAFTAAEPVCHKVSQFPCEVDPGLVEMVALSEVGEAPVSPDQLVNSKEPSLPIPPQLELVAPLLPLMLRQVTGLGWCLHLPFSRLSGALIAWLLCAVGLVESVSIRSVQRWLKTEKIKPWNVRSWITPKNLKDFLGRARVVLAVYARVPLFGPTEVAYSADEKTSIQARERASQEAPQKGKPGKLEHSYIRRGALQLFAALNIATGKIFWRIFPEKSFDEFSQFVICLIQDAIKQGYRTIHLILDNGSTHRPKILQAGINAWLVRQKLTDVSVQVHWLPVRSSWLNQVEIFFNHLQTFVLTVNNYPSIEALKEMIDEFIIFWNAMKGPIEWTYTVADLEHQFNRTSDTPDPRVGRARKRRYKKVAVNSTGTLSEPQDKAA